MITPDPEIMTDEQTQEGQFSTMKEKPYPSAHDVQGHGAIHGTKTEKRSSASQANPVLVRFW